MIGSRSAGARGAAAMAWRHAWERDRANATTGAWRWRGASPMACQVPLGMTATAPKETALAPGQWGHTLVLKFKHKVNQRFLRPRRGGPGGSRLRGHRGQGEAASADRVAPEFRDRGRAPSGSGAAQAFEAAALFRGGPGGPGGPGHFGRRGVPDDTRWPVLVRKSNKIRGYIQWVTGNIAALAVWLGRCGSVRECGRGRLAGSAASRWGWSSVAAVAGCNGRGARARAAGRCDVSGCAWRATSGRC